MVSEHLRDELEEIHESLQNLTKIITLIQMKVHFLECEVKDEIDTKQHLTVVNG